MSLPAVTMRFPFRLSVLPTWPLLVSIWQRFLFASDGLICYIVHQSPRNGKLLATWTTLRKNLRCSHRSDEMAVEAAVSCVGRHCQGCRTVADMSRRLSGSGWFPADRQRFTTAYDSRSRQKTGLRLPSTRWAMRRKAWRLSMDWATQTKTLRHGSTECAARLCVGASRCCTGTFSKRVRTSIAEGQPGVMARHGSGAHLLAHLPLFWLKQAVTSAFAHFNQREFTA